VARLPIIELWRAVPTRGSSDTSLKLSAPGVDGRIPFVIIRARRRS
jgi:hypothetical protein